jgi:hypothetical protein
MVVALLSLGCGKTRDASPIEPPPPPPEPARATGTVTVVGAERIPRKPTELVVRLRVANGTEAAADIYREALGRRLDDGGRTLTLVMHEVPTPPNGSSADCHVYVPRFATVPPRTTMTIDVTLPAVQQRGVFTPEGRMGVVPEDLSAATAVNVELGWSERSLAAEAESKTRLCRFEFQTALAAAERGVATGRFNL